MTCVPTCPMVTEYPSGAACAILFPAMVPPAPVTFSTTTVWPNARPMRSAMMRAMVSVGPPAANGTVTVTGREGYAWAAATIESADNAAAARTCTRSGVFMTRESNRFAPLRSRYGAFVIDAAFFLALWFMGALLAGSVGFEFNRWNAIALAAAYFGLFPATPLQGTPGKRACGIRTGNANGNPIAWPRSLARFPPT